MKDFSWKATWHKCTFFFVIYAIVIKKMQKNYIFVLTKVSELY
ncbi:hypothetical protein HMPREF9163_00419 [Selenomonas sp. oral taxon 138 str. F0429]|nr:hypothetical protein HMPREF9163_00419 [Selenomonas sp. oral taxon 138 str. F0429]